METDRKEDWELAGPGSVDCFLRSPDVSIWSNRTAAIRPASHKTPAEWLACPEETRDLQWAKRQ
jgi:hypothetical protein